MNRTIVTRLDLNEYNIRSCWSNLVELSFFAPSFEVISQFNNNWIYATDDGRCCGKKRRHHQQHSQQIYSVWFVPHVTQFDWPCSFETYCVRRTFCQYYKILLLLKLYHAATTAEKKTAGWGSTVAATVTAIIKWERKKSCHINIWVSGWASVYL